MVFQQQGRLRFGSPDGLPTASLAPLAAALDQSTDRQAQPLDGRAGGHVAEIPELGTVFVKHYLRGGAVSRIIDRGHLWNPWSRSRREHDALRQAREGGVRVPSPLAWAETSGIWVHCWLLMQAEPNARPFSALAREDPEHADSLMPAIAREVGRLVDMRMLHVDLHPGNILLDADEQPMVIDFDKARICPLDPDDLVDRYISRWSRAVAKHGLPDSLATQFAQLLPAAVRPSGS